MFDIKIKDNGVDAALAALEMRLIDMSPAMTDVATLLHNITDDSFINEKSPFGDAWEPLKSRVGQILNDKGGLVGSIEDSSGDDYAELAAGVVYAAIHQFGGYAGRASGKNGPIKRPYITARSYMPINSLGELPIDVSRDVVNTIESYLLNLPK